MNDALPGAAAALGWFLAFAMLTLALAYRRAFEVDEHRIDGSAARVLTFRLRPRLVEALV